MTEKQKKIINFLNKTHKIGDFISWSPNENSPEVKAKIKSTAFLYNGEYSLMVEVNGKDFVVHIDVNFIFDLETKNRI